MTSTATQTLPRTTAMSGAVMSLTLCVFVLIASEFMPVSLLTPIASDLSITEGVARQAISVSGLFAVITSLFIAAWTRNIDRKHVVAGLTLVLALSGVVVSLAPNLIVLMLGRALLGIAIGGFWSMSTAIVMRLLPQAMVPKGLAMLNAGNAIAATVAAPLGSYLGDLVGWRSAFFLVVPIGILALVWQWIELPPLAPERPVRSANPFALLRRMQVALGMASMLLLFAGQFALFTYLRPFLENVARFDVAELSALLFAMGLAGVAGTALIGRLLNTRLYSLLAVILLIMAALAVALVLFGTSPAATAILLVAWGFFGTAAPVGWGTWLSRALSSDAEAGGGLQVAVIQLAITAGAALGGLLFDTTGWWSAFLLASALLVGSSAAALAAWRDWNRASSAFPLRIDRIS